MRNIYFVDLESDETGECQGMFDEDGNLLGMWASNDGNWRGEYFDGFLRELGIKVNYGNKFNDELEKIAIEMWGRG